MTTLNSDGFRIDGQDLSVATPSSNDHKRVYNHDGSSSITLTDGSTTAKMGWYMWDNPQGAWFPMGQHADLVDGYHGADLATLAENESVTGTWDFGTVPTVGGTNTVYHEGNLSLSFSNINGSATEDQLDFREVPLSIPVTKWATGISDEEIWRIELGTGESLEVHRLEIEPKGGGSYTNLNVDVYDATNATLLASTTDVATGNPIATSGSGATILIRLTNGTGSYKNASIGGRLHIV